MRVKYWILKNKRVHEVPLLEWARWLETSHKERIIAKTKVGKKEVSPVFMGLVYFLVSNISISFFAFLFIFVIDLFRHRLVRDDLLVSRFCELLLEESPVLEECVSGFDHAVRGVQRDILAPHHAPCEFDSAPELFLP